MDKEKSETLKEISGDFIKSENKQKQKKDLGEICGYSKNMKSKK